MQTSDLKSAPAESRIARFIWDLTYACPLRCVHCYSESGRRPANALPRQQMLTVLQTIIDAKPQRVSLSGGEPLLVPWWAEAARALRAAQIPATVFTSGWLISDRHARELADCVPHVCVSVDGATEEINDAVRGRPGAFRRAMEALEILTRVKNECAAEHKPCYELGVDYTVTRSNLGQTERFVEEVTTRFPSLDFIRFGAAIPEGLAQESDFVAKEILRDDELAALQQSHGRLAARARNGVRVSVTDVRYFLFASPLSVSVETMIAHIEPDGQLRAFTNYEAKVGNVLGEPLDVLWQRALAWREDPFVAEQMRSIHSLDDWARVTRVLDRKYGSEADKTRIALRGTGRPGFSEASPAAHVGVPHPDAEN